MSMLLWRAQLFRVEVLKKIMPAWQRRQCEEISPCLSVYSA